MVIRSLFLVILMFFSIGLLSNSSLITANIQQIGEVLEDLPNEEGYPSVEDIQCSDAGICIVFYSRLGCGLPESCFPHGPYIKVINASNNFEILASLEINTTNNDASNEFSIALSQENADMLKIIGWIPLEGLFEVYWYKNTSQLLILKLDMDTNACIDNIPLSTGIFFPGRIHQETINENYTIFGQIGSKGYVTKEFIQITQTDCQMHELPFQHLEGYLPVNASFAYLFENTNNYQVLQIWFWINQTVLKNTVSLDNTILLDYFIGADLHPYATVRFSNFTKDNQLINLNAWTNISYSRVFDANLVDKEGVFHILLNGWNYDEKREYQQIFPNNTIKLSKIFSDIHNNSLLELITFSDNQHILGAYDDFPDKGFFQLNINNGTITVFNPFIITDIKTASFSSFFGILSIVLVALLLHKRKRYQLSTKSH